jgi:hypothetical protein
MTSEVIQQYEAALRRLISNQPASSGMRISYDGVAKAASHRKSSFSGKHNSPKVCAPKNQVQRAQILKDDMNS